MVNAGVDRQKFQNKWCNGQKTVVPGMPHKKHANLEACIQNCRGNSECAWVGFRRHDSYCEFWTAASCTNPHDQSGHDVYKVTGKCENACSPDGNYQGSGSKSGCTATYCNKYKPGGSFHSRCKPGAQFHKFALEECKLTCGICSTKAPTGGLHIFSCAYWCTTSR